ncbi:hypothetical protein CYMTET_38508 [Cymbomonas tetramitiformis]|uniref:DUF218 domain-containing protein n=1 Tax=Cymbomonas tetramitiformis TaxID=36881 RepID=A0AAE0CDB6_9CHLO|nr:hypothetical protein CYMTET_38508 [Cymbomonas tetramitiformis]
MGAQAIAAGVPKDALLLEHQARSTRENAVMVRALLASLPGRSGDCYSRWSLGRLTDLTVVTCDFHLPRARIYFDAAFADVPDLRLHYTAAVSGVSRALRPKMEAREVAGQFEAPAQRRSEALEFTVSAQRDAQLAATQASNTGVYGRGAFRLPAACGAQQPVRPHNPQLDISSAQRNTLQQTMAQCGSKAPELVTAQRGSKMLELAASAQRDGDGGHTNQRRRSSRLRRSLAAGGARHTAASTTARPACSRRRAVGARGPITA